jgi:hypothetical protein
LTLGQIPPEHYRYFLIREHAEQIRIKCREIGTALEAGRMAMLEEPTLVRGMRARPRRTKVARTRGWGEPTLAEVAAAEDMRLYLKELAAHSLPAADDLDEELTEVLRQMALLKVMAEAPADGSSERALLYLTTLDEARNFWPAFLFNWYLNLFGNRVGLTAEGVRLAPPPERLLILLSGPHAVALARMEEGTHLFYPAHENLVPVQVAVLPLQEGENPAARFTTFQNDRRAWLHRLAEGNAALEINPLALRPVLRIYDSQGPTVDLRTGLLTPKLPDGDVLRNFVLAALPLPPELLT